MVSSLEQALAEDTVKGFILQRLFQSVLLLIIVTSIVFFVGRLTGNPVDLMLPEDATEEERQDMIERLNPDGTVGAKHAPHVVLGVAQ